MPDPAGLNRQDRPSAVGQPAPGDASGWRQAADLLTTWYANGRTIEELATATGVPTQTIRRILTDAGTTLHRRGGHRITDEDTRRAIVGELQAKYEAGHSIRHLAALTGRSYGSIHRLLTEAGVSFPRPRRPLHPGILTDLGLTPHDIRQAQQVTDEHLRSLARRSRNHCLRGELHSDARTPGG